MARMNSVYQPTPNAKKIYVDGTYGSDTRGRAVTRIGHSRRSAQSRRYRRRGDVARFGRGCTPIIKSATSGAFFYEHQSRSMSSRPWCKISRAIPWLTIYRWAIRCLCRPTRADCSAAPTTRPAPSMASGPWPVCPTPLPSLMLKLAQMKLVRPAATAQLFSISIFSLALSSKCRKALARASASSTTTRPSILSILALPVLFRGTDDSGIGAAASVYSRPIPARSWA